MNFICLSFGKLLVIISTTIFSIAQKSLLLLLLPLFFVCNDVALLHALPLNDI